MNHDAAPSAGRYRVHGVLLVLLLGFASWQSYRAFADYKFEDAYITYRYARNLAEGHGFVFNAGERLLGTSTPLYTMLLAVAHWAGADIPTTSNVVFVVSLALVGWIGFAICARSGNPLGGFVFALATVWGAGNIFYVFGMETALHVALLFAALWLALGERFLTASTVAAFAVLNRYDAVVFLGCLLLFIAWRRRRIPWRHTAVAAAIVTPWLLFAQLYFGSMLPNSLPAKAGDVTSLGFLRQSVEIQLEHSISPLYRFWHQWHVPAVIRLGLPFLFFLAIPFLLPKLLRRSPALAIAVASAVLTSLGYSVIGPPPWFHWYLVPTVFMLGLVATLAWGLLAARFMPMVVASGGRFATYAAAGLTLLSFLLLPAAAARDVERWRSDHYDARIGTYDSLARLVGRAGMTHLSTLSREPGYYGYVTGSPMIDAAGLVTRDVYFHGPLERRSRFVELIERFEPDLFMTEIWHWPHASVEGYLPLSAAFPARILFVSERAFADHFEGLAELWFDDELGDETPAWRHPIRVDVDRATPEVWSRDGGWLDGARRLSGLRYRDQPFDEVVGMSPPREGSLRAAVTPVFEIDFDELRFLFAATHRHRTVAQLLIDWQVVYEEIGDPNHPLELRDVAWPVSPWMGRTARLRFLDVEREARNFFAFDRIESVRYRRSERIDDFESAAFAPFWDESSTMRLTELEVVAKQHGLAFLVGRRAVTSHGQSGELILRSHPFRLTTNTLTFVLFDFALHGTTVRLRLGDRIVRETTGRGTQQLEPIIWGVAKLLGREAVLELVDDNPDPAAWVGIDEIRMVERP